MKLPYDLCIIDLELGNPNTSMEGIIELGAVKFNRYGFIEDFGPPYQSLVTAAYPLNPGIIELTGITESMMSESSKELSIVNDELKEYSFFNTKNVVLAAWGNDVNYYKEVIQKNGLSCWFKGTAIDIKSFAIISSSIFGKKVKTTGLQAMLKLWGLEFSEIYGKEHRALADAYNTARLLSTIWDHYAKIKSTTVELSSLIFNAEKINFKDEKGNAIFF